MDATARANERRMIMSRLIDADEFQKQIVGMAILNNYPPDKANALCKLVDSQPTAFDVEKVVEQLESLKEKGACYDVQCKHCNYSRRCWDGEYADSIALDKAIDIVKRGGKHEE